VVRRGEGEGYLRITTAHSPPRSLRTSRKGRGLEGGDSRPRREADDRWTIMMDMNSLRPKGGRKDYHQNDSCSFRPKGRGHDQQNLKPTNALVKADSSRNVREITPCAVQKGEGEMEPRVTNASCLPRILGSREGARPGGFQTSPRSGWNQCTRMKHYALHPKGRGQSPYTQRPDSSSKKVDGMQMHTRIPHTPSEDVKIRCSLA
ncbi:MAG: hypothetical protein UY72_C0040G0006, partial [Candidatus Uhrbacteria bacterium GW2011_GWD2_52_7]